MRKCTELFTEDANLLGRIACVQVNARLTRKTLCTVNNAGIPENWHRMYFIAIVLNFRIGSETELGPNPSGDHFLYTRSRRQIPTIT